VAGPAGALEPAEIADYEVRVSGPIPHTFKSSNPDAQVVAEGSVCDTGSVIMVSPGCPNNPDAYGLLGFGEELPHLPQERRWIGWYFEFGLGFDADVWYSRWNGQRLETLGVWRTEPTIVVASVPEPSSVMLLLLGTFLVGFFARRNRDSAKYS